MDKYELAVLCAKKTAENTIFVDSGTNEVIKVAVEDVEEVCRNVIALFLQQQSAEVALDL